MPGRPIHYSRSQRFLALISALLISLLAAEIGVRLLVDDSGITPQDLWEKSVQYVPTVFARHAFPREVRDGEGWRGTRWRINRFGYRGPDFSWEKAPGTVRVYLCGGSAVFDPANTAGQDWPRRVERMLHDRGLRKVEVINAGIPGHASFDCVGRLFAEGHLLEPDYAVIYNAWNDFKEFLSDEPLLRSAARWAPESDPRVSYRGDADRFLSERSHLYNVGRRALLARSLGDEGRIVATDRALPFSAVSASALDQYRLSMQTYVDIARNAGAVPVLMTQARLVHRFNTAEERERISYRFIGLDAEALVQAFEASDRIVREVAVEKESLLIDASAALSKQSSAFRDHVHLNDEGSQALARVVADAFSEWLRSETDS